MRRRLGPIALVLTLSLTAAGVLAQAEAERQLDAAIERLRAALGPDGRLTIGSREVDPVTGRARLGNVVISYGTRRISAEEMVLQDVSVTRLGRGEARRIRVEQGKNEVTEAARLLVGGFPIPPEGTPFTPDDMQFELFELEEVRNTQPGQGSFTLGRVVARDYQRAFAGTPGTLGSGLIEGFRLESQAPTTPNAEIGRFVASSLTFPSFRSGSPDPRVFRAGELTVEGFRLRDPSKNLDFELPRLALRDWLPGRQTALAIEGVSVSTDFGELGPGRFRLGRVSASGIDAATTLAAVLDNVQPPDPAIGVPQVMAFEGLEMEAGGAPLFALGRLAVDGRMDAAGLGTGSMLMEGLRVNIPRGSAPPLEGMGFQEITGSMELRAEGRRDGGDARVNPFRLAWDNAGVLTLDAGFANVPASPAGSKVEPDEQMARYLGMQLSALTLRFRDQGLVGRAVALIAQQQRVPEARLRERWAQMALGMPIPGAQQGPRKGQPQVADPFASMRQAVASFIRQPGTLEVSLRPPQPVAFGEMAGLGAAGPAGAVQRLGLDVRVP